MKKLSINVRRAVTKGYAWKSLLILLVSVRTKYLLEVNHFSNLVDSGVQHLALRSRFLSVLDLSCTGISDEALVFLSQGCCRSVLNQLKHNVPPAKLNK